MDEHRGGQVAAVLAADSPAPGAFGVVDGSVSDAFAAAVSGLSGVDLSQILAGVGELADLDGYALVEVAVGWEKVARHARAQVLRAVGELGARRDVLFATGALPDHTDRRAPQVAYFAASEVSLALGVSAGAADGLLSDAVLLTSRLPQVLTALEDGRIHERAAHVLVAETIVLDDDTASVVAGAVLGRQQLRTVPQITRAARTAVAAADPATAAAREQRAVTGRFVRPYKAITDGMVAWEGWLPVSDSMAVWDRLCAIGEATKVPGDPRGIDARRADAAVALLLGEPIPTLDGRPDPSCAPSGSHDHTTDTANGADGRVGDGSSAAIGGDRSRVSGGTEGVSRRRWRKVWRTDVVVAASTLAGADEQPGLVPGWGVITAPTARRLASGAPSDTTPAENDRERHIKGDGSDAHNGGSGPDGGGTDRGGGTDHGGGTDRCGGVDHGGGNDLDGRADGRLLGDAQWRRILTDPHSGLVTDYGTTRYRPPDSLGDYVRARDGRCYEPLCQRSAWAGDLDHIRNSPAGPSPRPHPDGATSAANLGAGCRRGHGAKAAPGWSVEAPTEGRFIWTTPTGHTHTREPEPPLDWWNHTWTTSQPEEKAETGVETEFDRMAQSRAEPESAADAESEAEPDSAAQAESETGLESEALPDIGTVRDIGAEEGHTSAAASQADQAQSARQPLEDQPPPF